MNNGAEYSFIEYSYNEDVISTDVIEQKITDLGFTKRTRNEEGSFVYGPIYGIAVSRKCLEPGITGIGVVVPTEIITSLFSMKWNQECMFIHWAKEIGYL